MPTNLPHVRPGDLITASQWNAVLDWLAELQATVDTLGAGGSPSGPPAIVSLHPTGQPAVGSELLIIGSGFGVASENVVTIASIVAQILGGGGAQLRVRVPTISGVPPTGLDTQLTVSNPRGFAAHPVRVMPAVLTMPEGQLFVNMTTSPSGTLDAGTTADFIFTVRAVVNIQETYTLTPLLTPDTAPTEWRAEVLDAGGNPMNAITLPAGPPPDGVTRQVTVRVTIPPGTDGTTCGLSLAVRSQRNASLATASPSFTLAVGSAAPPPEQLTLTRAAVQNGALDPDGTVVARTSTTRVTLSVAGTQTDTAYTLSLGTVPAGWNVSVVGAATRTATGAQLQFRVDIVPAGGSAATLNLRVAQADDDSVFGTLQLAVRPE